VIIFASTGFITLRQITTNIESSVATETRPLFWADLIVSPRGYASGDVLPLVAEYLEWEEYVAAEKREFSTTLLDKEGKAGLVQVVAYSGSYPQRGILKVESMKNEVWRMKNGKKETGYTGFLPTQEWQEQQEWYNRVAVTPWLIEKFASGGMITLDGKNLKITDKIIESSDLGFSLGTENHLIVLPSALLSGSLLLSSGSRLDHDLLISFNEERRAMIIAQKLKAIFPETLYRVRTYEDRTERNLDTVETLTDYITLILLVASIFAFIILRSAHEAFYESLARTLRVTEILGLTRRRQQILLSFLYSLIFPLAFLLSIGISYSLIRVLQRVPEASEFEFYISSLSYALLLLLAIVVMAWWPVWWRLASVISSEGDSRSREIFIWEKSTQWQSTGLLRTSQWLKRWIVHFFIMTIQVEVLVPFVLGVFILILLFQSPLFALSVAVGAGVFYLVFAWVIRSLYVFMQRKSEPLREKRFYLYDAIRALVRPLTPTLPITISLVSVTVFFLVFASFSLAFRSKLVIDSSNTANIYAINILEQDRQKVEKIIGSWALMYDILRARIEWINGRTLAEHLGQERPSGEFTREFNVTTTPLENKVLRGKEMIQKWEISMDDDFASRLGVDIWDKITFLLSGREFTLEIANIRESIREGFRPFFYFSFDPVEFARAPRTYFIAEYASDTEAWKREILAASGPHVTFIDIESVLKIVRDISTKVLSVIWLFGGVVFLFAVGAIIAFFTRMRPIEDMKSRLYSLFGACTQGIRTSLTMTRVSIFIVSYILSIIIWGVLSYFVLSMGSFFSFSLSDFLLLSGLTAIVYGVMMVWMRR
jgi:predicted lysophospholipase L1 biosynthesis ABC-type transport system permease subunit